MYVPRPYLYTVQLKSINSKFYSKSIKIVRRYYNVLFVQNHGQVQGRVVTIVNGGRVRAAADQHADAPVFAVQHAKVQGRSAVRVAGVRVRAALQQQPDDAMLAGLQGHVHRVVGRLAGGQVQQVPAVGDRRFHRREVAPLDCVPQVEARRGRRPFLATVLAHRQNGSKRTSFFGR